MKRNRIARKREQKLNRRLRAKHFREIESITSGLKILKTGILDQQSEIEKVLDKIAWRNIRQALALKAKGRNYQRAYYLLKKYEGFWLGKICRAPGGLRFRKVIAIKIELSGSEDWESEEVHVVYEGRWEHRVNARNGGSQLPGKSALLIQP
jgi:hypothetical protein